MQSTGCSYILLPFFIPAYYINMLHQKNTLKNNTALWYSDLRIILQCKLNTWWMHGVYYHYSIVFILIGLIYSLCVCAIYTSQPHFSQWALTVICVGAFRSLQHFVIWLWLKEAIFSCLRTTHNIRSLSAPRASLQPGMPSA